MYFVSSASVKCLKCAANSRKSASDALQLAPKFHFCIPHVQAYIVCSMIPCNTMPIVDYVIFSIKIRPQAIVVPPSSFPDYSTMSGGRSVMVCVSRGKSLVMMYGVRMQRLRKRIGGVSWVAVDMQSVVVRRWSNVEGADSKSIGWKSRF